MVPLHFVTSWYTHELASSFLFRRLQSNLNGAWLRYFVFVSYKLNGRYLLPL
ncbi:hypothetical protein AAZX31_06G038800 [Glycine max]